MASRHNVGLAVSVFLVGSLLTYWLVSRSSSDERPVDKESTMASSVSGNGKDTHVPSRPDDGRDLPPAPVRMSGASGGPSVPPVAEAGSLEGAFLEETVDAEAATANTRILQTTVDNLVASGEGAARIADLSCRAQHCKLTLESDDSKGLVSVVDAMQDERGLLGVAESLMLKREGEAIVLFVRFPPKADLNAPSAVGQ